MRHDRHVIGDGLWGATLAAMMLATAGCGRTEPVAAAQPELATPAQPTASGPLDAARRATTVRPADLRPIREITLELPTGGKGFEVRKPGPPRTAFSAPHLTFVGAGPVAPGKIIVAVKESEAYESKILETHLIDLDRGSIAKFSRASQWQVPELGLAKVFVEIDGVGQPALLHASDGHIVRLYAGLDPTTTEVVINPGRGDGWVFAHDASDPAVPTRYAHWKDLRSPPPQPDRTLPFSVTNMDHFADVREPPAMTRIELPSVGDPRAIDPIVFNEAHTDGCNRLELRADGSFACAEYVVALGGGWRVEETERETVMHNVQTNEVQHLDLGEHCTGKQLSLALVASVFDPPRVLFGCGKQGYEVLWSPEAVEIVRERHRDRRRRDATQYWSADGSHRIVARLDPDVGRLPIDGWFDLDDRVLVMTTDLDHAPPRTPSAVHLVTPVSAPGDLYAAYPGVGAGVIAARTRCVMLGEEARRDPFVILTCEDAAERAVSTELIDTEKRVRWHLPAARGFWEERAWIDVASHRAVMHQRRGGKSVVEVREL